jgi:nucleoid-associated protein YgaU
MATRCRCLLVWLALTAGTGAVARWAAAAVEPADRFDGLVAAVAGIALVGCATWAWVVGTVVVAHAVRRPGRPARSPRGVPSWVTRVVLAACGLAVVATVPAHASYGVTHPAQHASPGSDVSVDGLPFPDRAVGPAGATPPTPVPRTAPRWTSLAAATVVVQPGDSLWRVAERLLGADASDAEVAATTQALHELNRAAIGPDPDLIHPGLHLRTPGS